MHCIMTLWQAAKSHLVAFHGRKMKNYENRMTRKVSLTQDFIYQLCACLRQKEQDLKVNLLGSEKSDPTYLKQLSLSGVSTHQYVYFAAGSIPLSCFC